MAIILTDINGTVIKGDSTPNALRVINYDSNGVPVAHADRSAITPGTTAAALIAGADYKQARLIRSSPEGTLRAGQDTLLFYDNTEVATLDTNKWLSTLTTMTITLTLGTGRLYNASNIGTTTTGAMLTSARQFPFMGRAGLVYRSRARATAHSNNNVHELGFGAPTSATSAAIVNGAVWRKNDSGWTPIVSLGSSDTAGTTITNATFIASIPTTDYALFTIFVEETRATFRITTTTGVMVNEQVVEFPTASGTFTVAHHQILERTYNSGTVSSPVQLYVAQTSVWMLDVEGYNWQSSMVGQGLGSLTTPTAFTQNANYANSAAPASATLSNTAAGYTTLGGQWQFAAVGGAETDYALFGFTVPSPYSFTATKVSISAYNTGAANATTLTVLQWGLAFNSSAVSLATAAPQSPMRKTIGSHSFTLSAAIGASGGNDIVWVGSETVFPGRFFHVILKIPIGTATGSQIIRGVCTVEGYFE